MFSAIVLPHDREAGSAIESLAVASKQVAVSKILEQYPQGYELARLLNAYSPQLVFLDFGEWETALMLANGIRELSPRSAIIGYGAGWKTGQARECAYAGVAELLVSPVTLKNFEEAVERAILKNSSSIQENLIAFLPAKAGSGATTVALNTAGYLADPLGKKTLLIDCDLNSSVVSTLLDLKDRQSLRDALDSSGQLDTSEWSRFVAKARGIDLLLPDHLRRSPLPSWSNYHHLLDFLAGLYAHIVVDLPEVVNDATVETVRRAKQVFIVCTPELPSLALASYRIEELTCRGISDQKIELVLNRWHKGEIGEADLQEMLKHPVAAVFENDYPTVSASFQQRAMVDGASKLGKSFAAFARKLAGEPEIAAPVKFSFLKGLGRASSHA